MLLLCQPNVPEVVVNQTRLTLVGPRTTYTEVQCQLSLDAHDAAIRCWPKMKTNFTSFCQPTRRNICANLSVLASISVMQSQKMKMKKQRRAIRNTPQRPSRQPVRRRRKQMKTAFMKMALMVFTLRGISAMHCAKKIKNAIFLAHTGSIDFGVYRAELALA